MAQSDPGQRVRCWPWVLGLLVGAPFYAETVASSNTPLVLFPVVLPLFAVVYGCPALLVRELWVRNRLTAPRVLVAGLATTALNEGVVAATWFKLSDQGVVLSFTAAQAGRAGGVNWGVLVGLVVFHTVWSVALPVLLVEALARVRRSPVAGQPWLHRRGVVVALVLLSLLLIGSLTPDGAAQACAGPVVTTCTTGRELAGVIAAGATVLLLLLALALAEPSRRSRGPDPTPAVHGVGRPVAGGLAFAAAFFVAFFALPLAGQPGAAVLVQLTLLAAVGFRARSWCRPWPVPTTVQVAVAAGATVPGAAASLLAWPVGQPLGAALATVGIVMLVRRARQDQAPAAGRADPTG